MVLPLPLPSLSAFDTADADSGQKEIDKKTQVRLHSKEQSTDPCSAPRSFGLGSTLLHPQRRDLDAPTLQLLRVWGGKAAR